MNHFRVLALGDIVGAPGREACRILIPKLIREQEIDFVIANAENIADGSGITTQDVQELFRAGVDIITTGDHVFRKKEAKKLVAEDPRILRPANYPSMVPGSGCALANSRNGQKVGVINVMGRVFLKTLDCPFESALRHVDQLQLETKIILVDIHAEATSEKMALGWFLDGKVSAVFGTHTHVQTADEQVFPRGTGYLTDLGMCGPFFSVIGRQIEHSLHLFLTQMPTKLEVAQEDPRISGAVFDIDPETGKTLSVTRVHERLVHETV